MCIFWEEWSENLYFQRALRWCWACWPLDYTLKNKQGSVLSVYWNHLVNFSNIPMPGPNHRGSDVIGLGWALAFSISIKLPMRVYHAARVENFFSGLGHCPVSCTCVLLPSFLLSFQTLLLKTESDAQQIDISGSCLSFTLPPDESSLS